MPQPEYLHTDANYWALNKSSGVALLADRDSDVNVWQSLKDQKEQPYLVHRLDKGTSGVLLVARNQAFQSRLTRAFMQRHIDKYYLTWVCGKVAKGVTYTIDLPLCKGRKSRYRVAGPRQSIRQVGTRFEVDCDREGVDALTRVRCLKHTSAHSLVLAKPLTGRTHQLRVHLAWLGHAIVGDHLYGTPKALAQQGDRLMLHCHRLVWPGEFALTAPVPKSFLGEDR